MRINRLKIVNYKLFQNAIIEMNDDMNIFVGENDSGKTTILEALAMVLTGRINGSNIVNRFNLDWFNVKARKNFIEAIKSGNTPVLPTIEIEAYFSTPGEDEVAIKNSKERITHSTKIPKVLKWNLYLIHNMLPHISNSWQMGKLKIFR